MDAMRIDILTLFPDSMRAVLGESILGRAAQRGILDIRCHQIRDYTENRQKQVDDYPYGGGWGQIMMAQPLKSCLDAVMADAGERRSRVIYLSPQGQPFTQEKAKQLKRDYDHLVLVCGHYEGVDERFLEACVDEEISLGDFVLTGGEIAAMAVADCVCRMVPGVLADEACYTGESHWDGLLEYPQYTRPEVWEGRAVPEVLRGGNHAEIETWRRQKSLERTMDKRPDLFRAFCPDAADQKLIARIQKQRSRRKLSHPAVCRAAAEDDLPAILEIVRQAKNYLRRHRVDQWQGEYPAEAVFRADIARGECYVLDYDGEVAGMFTLSAQPEPAYAALTDGKWRSGEDYCVLHRNAVRADFRGTGVSDTMLQAVEALTRQRGCTAVRVDTHRKNKGQLRLLKAHGYRYCGNILIDSEPGHDPKRQAFEKILKMQAF